MYYAAAAPVKLSEPWKLRIGSVVASLVGTTL